MLTLILTKLRLLVLFYPFLELFFSILLSMLLCTKPNLELTEFFEPSVLKEDFLEDFIDLGNGFI
jgi:hypothetical protein